MYQRTGLRLLMAPIFIFAFSTSAFAQNVQSEVTVPEQAMEQVVRRILIWSFKPRKKPTVVYVADQGIKDSWLPKIENIEFRLLPIEQIQKNDLKVHFFTEPDLSGNTYGIGFAFGDPSCEYSGNNWQFRITKQRVKLWLSGGVGGGCGSSSGNLTRRFDTLREEYDFSSKTYTSRLRLYPRWRNNYVDLYRRTRSATHLGVNSTRLYSGA